MDNKDTTAAKDPMRDSLLSSDCEGDDAPDITLGGNGWFTSEEQAWEGVGQCRDIYKDETQSRIDNLVPSSSPPSSITIDARDTSQHDSWQQELEFDYWQGQFEFCSPALQDYPFIPLNMIDNSSDGNDASCKDLINTVSYYFSYYRA